MNSFDTLIWKFEKRQLAAEGFERQVANGVFQEQRDRLLISFLAMVRMHYAIDWRNSALPHSKPFTHPIGAESREWSNAAALILGSADESVQRFFLVSDHATKNKLVQAVVDDGGIHNFEGFFVEIPA